MHYNGYVLSLCRVGHYYNENACCNRKCVRKVAESKKKT